ncbi:MAG TPA: MYXO-CTERM sorting domain-containing protein [Polyangiaceae bacterium]|nr:MYXO-CTERM sorting domain-containing protein [Polyangiaceae bacterium]
MKIRVFLPVLSFLVGAPAAAFAVDASAPPADAGARTDASTSRADASVPRADASSPTADASVRDASSTTDASDAAPEGPSHLVGRSCTQDGDCATGLTCLTGASKTLGGGAPAKGLCTKDCATGGQAACDAVDRGSVCRPFDETGKVAYCYERCTPGNGQDAPKCHKRPDMACAPNPSRQTEGYCAPTCRGDFDCEGRRCNPLTGLCVDSVEGTLTVGAACDPPVGEAGTLPPNAQRCMGACLTVGSPPSRDNSACTAVCSVGVTGACGEDPSSQRRAQAACEALFPAIEGTGDIGACVQLCDCDSDCDNPAFVCTTLSPNSGLGRAGECVLSGPGVQHFTCASQVDSGSRPNGSGGAKGSGGGGNAGGSAGAAAAPAKDDSGCGCRVGGAGSSPRDFGAFGLGVAMAGLLARRRLRRSRGRA